MQAIVAEIVRTSLDASEQRVHEHVDEAIMALAQLLGAPAAYAPAPRPGPAGSGPRGAAPVADPVADPVDTINPATVNPTRVPPSLPSARPAQPDLGAQSEDEGDEAHRRRRGWWRPGE